MDLLDAWLNCREPMLREKYYGDSIETVEELLRRHDDFEKTVSAQEDKFSALNRRVQVGDYLDKN